MSIQAVREKWLHVANGMMQKVAEMSPKQHKKDVDEVRRGLQDTPTLNRDITSEELTLRAFLQGEFTTLDSNILQLDFTHFHKRVTTIKQVLAVKNDDKTQTRQRANAAIVDELGKTLLRRGIQPTMPQTSQNGATSAASK